MDIVAYLKRINFDGPLAPTAETLRQLQVARLLAGNQGGPRDTKPNAADYHQGRRA